MIFQFSNWKSPIAPTLSVWALFHTVFWNSNSRAPRSSDWFPLNACTDKKYTLNTKQFTLNKSICQMNACDALTQESHSITHYPYRSVLAKSFKSTFSIDIYVHQSIPTAAYLLQTPLVCIQLLLHCIRLLAFSNALWKVSTHVWRTAETQHKFMHLSISQCCSNAGVCIISHIF